MKAAREVLASAEEEVRAALSKQQKAASSLRQLKEKDKPFNKEYRAAHRKARVAKKARSAWEKEKKNAEAAGVLAASEGRFQALQALQEASGSFAAESTEMFPSDDESKGAFDAVNLDKGDQRIQLAACVLGELFKDDALVAPKVCALSDALSAERFDWLDCFNQFKLAVSSTEKQAKDVALMRAYRALSIKRHQAVLHCQEQRLALQQAIFCTSEDRREDRRKAIVRSRMLWMFCPQEEDASEALGPNEVPISDDHLGKGKSLGSFFVRNPKAPQSPEAAAEAAAAEKAAEAAAEKAKAIEEAKEYADEAEARLEANKTLLKYDAKVAEAEKLLVSMDAFLANRESMVDFLAQVDGAPHSVPLCHNCAGACRRCDGRDAVVALIALLPSAKKALKKAVYVVSEKAEQAAECEVAKAIERDAAAAAKDAVAVATEARETAETAEAAIAAVRPA